MVAEHIRAALAEWIGRLCPRSCAARRRVVV